MNKTEEDENFGRRTVVLRALIKKNIDEEFG